MFFAYKKGFGGYEYVLSITASSVSQAKKKLFQQGYGKGKWLIIKPRNIVQFS